MPSAQSAFLVYRSQSIHRLRERRAGDRAAIAAAIRLIGEGDLVVGDGVLAAFDARARLQRPAGWNLVRRPILVRAIGVKDEHIARDAQRRRAERLREGEGSA